MVTEIDYDSTIVGGRDELIGAILHADGFEDFEVGPGADLSSMSGTINSSAPPAV